MYPNTTREKGRSSTTTIANAPAFSSLLSALLSKLRPLHRRGLVGWALHALACLLILGMPLVFSGGIARADAPTLVVYPTSLTQSSPQCFLDSYHTPTFHCTVSLGETIYSNNPVNWTSSSSLAGVKFNPASGTLQPGQTIQVKMTAIPCTNGTFTFSGQSGVTPVSVPWNCTLDSYFWASPGKLNPTSTSNCVLDAPLSATYKCGIFLHSHSHGTINWSASSDLSGVTFNPSSGVLQPDKSVKVIIDQIPCQNGTFTFSGSSNSVAIPWSCTPPILLVRPTSLNQNSAQCSSTGGIYQCTITLGESPKSHGKVNWSASSSLSRVTFSPASGTLSPGGKGVQVTIAAIPCQNGTFTFSGSGGTQAVAVPWYCPVSPTLIVKPGSLIPKNCALSGNTFTCRVTLYETPSSKGPANWSASSSLSGVTFTPASGTLHPGKSVIVTITAIPCQNGTFTFTGKEGETPVNVTWSCKAPPPSTLMVSPSSLDPSSTKCRPSHGLFTCTVSLRESWKSHGYVNWSASSNLSGVTFSPASGTLKPGQGVQVTISTIPCQNGSFTFSGKEGETPVSVTWNCTSPTLSVSPTSLDPTITTSCGLDSPMASVYNCLVSLGETSSSNTAAHWSASSDLSGVTFTPSSGILYPGRSHLVAIQQIPCQNGSFTFSGKEGETPVSVTWSCTPPTLTVSPSSLDQQNSNCSTSGGTYQCTVSLGESSTSQGNVNWSASSDINGVTFNPSSGTLSPGETTTVTIAAIPCQNGTFTFAGSGGAQSIAVPWSCTAQPPTLTVTPTSLDPTSTANCNLDAPMSATYKCTVLLGETSSSQGNANWSTSSSLNGVTFTPSSGTLQPGGSISVTIDQIPCQNGSFTFSGSEGETPVSVTWSCTSPTLTVSPNALNQNSASCTASGNTYQCTITLGESSSSQGSVNWATGSDMNGVTFSPSSGTLQPGGSTSVAIAAIPCQNGTFTFSGSGGAQSVAVPWSCTLPPTLTVNPTNLDPTNTGYCVLDAPMSATYQCIVALGETSSSQGTANWSTSSDLSGVTFTPSSGALQPGGSVTITIDQIPCQNGSFTFSGNEGETPVSSTWSCTPPTLTVSPTTLNNGQCGGAENASQCTVTVGESSTSQSGMNWAASSNLSGVSFIPASGTLSPGQTATVTVSSIPCQNGTFTFNGSGGASAVAVTWTCANWESIGYDSQNTRSNPLETGLTPSNVSGLVVAWHNNLGVAGGSSPVVVNNMVYINDTHNFLDALNITTGAVVWQDYVAAPLNVSPVVSNGIIYDGGSTTNNVGGLFAIDAATGAVLWHVDNSSPTYTPTVANGVVYVGINDGNNGSISLNAFDASSGTLLWSTAGGSYFAPAVDNGVVFSASSA